MLWGGWHLPRAEAGPFPDGGVMESTPKARANPLVWLAVASAGVLAVIAGASPAIAEMSAQLTYQVNHSVFGEIGTYTNTVEPTRDGTTVQTRAHFEVKMLGVKMYREDAERTEHWQGNRLVSFRS